MTKLNSTGQDFDLIIKNGLVYDGTLSDPVKADIGVNGDKIEFVGYISGGAGKIIDATGHIVTPGFIDVHTHCDSTFSILGNRLDRLNELPGVKGNHNYLYQGVTTVVSGNCGDGYSDLNRWFDVLDKIQFGTNVYHLAPHGAIRAEVFGEDQPLELNPKQMDAMKKRVAEEMEKGAIGMSSGLIYAPGLLANNQEFIELNKVVSEYNRIYTTHMRSESGEIGEDGLSGFEKAFNDTILVAREAEVPVEISHLKLTVPLEKSQAGMVLELIEKARADGLQITADQYPYDAGSSHLAIFMPNYMKSQTGIKEQYKKPEARDELRKAIKAEFSILPPEKTLVTIYTERKDLEGKNIQEIAELEGKDPIEVYADMLCEKRAPTGVFFSQDMDVVRKLMPAEYVMTGSDGWTIPFGRTVPHPRTYGTFPTKIKKYALEDKLLPLNQAIYSMTGLPAEAFKMKSRGRIENGAYADIAVINLDKLEDNSTYIDPHHYAKGVNFLLVNGSLAIDNGKATQTESGRALRM
jgi:N-acyl-D-amino-acid deacylase